MLRHCSLIALQFFTFAQLALLGQAIPRVALQYKNVFGGTGIYNYATAVAVDSAGNTYVTGATSSRDFPVKNALQPQMGGANLESSIDGGNNWRAPSIPYPVFSIASSPKAPSIVFAGTSNGVYKSADGGQTWTSVASPYLGGGVSAISVDAINPQIVNQASDFGMLQSTDAGATWTETNPGAGPMLVLAFSSALPSTLYSASGSTLGGQSSSGTYRSTDRGATWSHLSSAPPYVFAITCDPSNPSIVYAAGGDAGTSIYRSINSGGSWKKTADLSLTDSTFCLLATPTALLAGTADGLLISRDGGATWNPSNLTDSVGTIAIDPNNAQIVYADGDSIYKSTDGGMTFTPVLPVRLNTQTIAVLPGNPPVVFVGAQTTSNAFLTKWSADGSQMIYSTFLGGSSGEAATGLAVDSQGNAYVTGYSSSSDFPVTLGASQGKNLGEVNAFLTKISPQGDQILYSTYLGGSLDDAANAVAVDTSGNAYVTGLASSADFPNTAGSPRIAKYACAADSSNYEGYAGPGNAFVTKLNTNTGQIVYSTPLNAGCREQGLGIVVDPNGNAIVVGVTTSLSFPVTPGAVQSVAGNSNSTGFLAKLNPQGVLTYATYLGGSSISTVQGVALDSKGSVYFTGATAGFDSVASPPVATSALKPGLFAGLQQLPVGTAYVLKLNYADWSRQYLKYVGGDGFEGQGISVDSHGRAWIIGGQNSAFFPPNPPFPLVHPFEAGTGSAFVAQLSADGSTVPFYSFTDDGSAIVLDSSGNARLGGGFFARKATLIRLDTDVPSAVTAEEPVSLIPQNALNPRTGSIAPGELVVIPGLGLGPSQTVYGQVSATNTLPTALAGTAVTVNGIAAQLISVQAEQIVCMVPYAISNDLVRVVQVTSSAGLANSITEGFSFTAIAVSAPVNADGSVNSAARPAAPGSVVTVYGTGFGPTTPPTADGVAQFSEPRLFFDGMLEVLYSGTKSLPIVYVGSAPGQLSGVTQIDFTVPSALPAGMVSLQIGLLPGAAAGQQLVNGSTVSLYVGASAANQ